MKTVQNYVCFMILIFANFWEEDEQQSNKCLLYFILKNFLLHRNTVKYSELFSCGLFQKAAALMR